MHFKRFLEINVKENNHFIVFKDNKIIYEPDLKTFLLESNYLDIDTKNALFIGIAESEKKIYFFIAIQRHYFFVIYQA